MEDHLILTCTGFDSVPICPKVLIPGATTPVALFPSMDFVFQVIAGMGDDSTLCFPFMGFMPQAPVDADDEPHPLLPDSPHLTVNLGEACYPPVQTLQFTMGALLSYVSSDSPLSFLLNNPVPLQLALDLKYLFFLCNQVWPKYNFNNQSKWPFNDPNIIQALSTSVSVQESGDSLCSSFLLSLV